MATFEYWSYRGILEPDNSYHYQLFNCLKKILIIASSLPEIARQLFLGTSDVGTPDFKRLSWTRKLKKLTVDKGDFDPFLDFPLFTGLRREEAVARVFSWSSRVKSSETIKKIGWNTDLNLSKRRLLNCVFLKIYLQNKIILIFVVDFFYFLRCLIFLLFRSSWRVSYSDLWSSEAAPSKCWNRKFGPSFMRFRVLVFRSSLKKLVTFYQFIWYYRCSARPLATWSEALAPGRHQKR